MKTAEKNQRRYSTNGKNGFTLVEIIVVVAVFLMITTAITATYVKIYQLLEANKIKITALDLANEQIEIIRNLPYSDVGEISGIPSGKIPHTQILSRSGITFAATTTIRNIDDPFDGQIGSSTKRDLSPADYKMVEVDISPQTNYFTTPLSLVTYVAPKNLEGSSNNGALFVKVFDADGIPIQGANIHIENKSITPNVIIDDVSDDQGMLNIVDVPPSSAYKIIVTENGYSTDQTYPNGGSGNPNPTKPNATVVAQQVTQVSFSIDQLSSLNFQTIDSMCNAVPNIPFSLTGSKLIGTPNVHKYTANLSTGSDGSTTQNNLEWDSYTPALTSSSYDLLGSNPIFPLNLLPDSTQAVEMVVGPKDPNTVLVGVTDSSTGLPLTNATVTLSSGSFTRSLTTGRGFTKQTDWSGGGGQTDYVTQNKYYSDDGNVDVTTTPGQITLAKVFGAYKTSGTLTSSVFDMGATTTFKQITWAPNDQPKGVSGIGSIGNGVKMQVAVSDTDTATTTWNYIGPDGTAGTYFTVSSQDISVGNIGRYIRYKLYLSTARTTVTPNISDILMTYTSSCLPPGQAVFTGLSSGTYTVDIDADGYDEYEGSINVNTSYQSTNITLSQ